MTQKDLETALEILDWSNTEASNHLGLSRQSLIRYLKGKRPIPLLLEKSILAHIKLKKAMDVIS